MAEGSKIGFQGNVPLDGESNIVQTVAGLASDVLTITGAAGQTGDFLVCQNSAGTEKFYVTSAGAVVAAGAVLPMGQSTQASLTALATTSGATAGAFPTSAAWLLAVQMVNTLQTRLVGLGFLT